eukprot:gene37883-46018_t
MDDTATEVPIEATEKPVDSAQDANGVGQESDGWRVSQDAPADSAGDNKPGWYFGKYVGLRKHKATEAAEQDYPSSSWFGFSTKPSTSTSSTSTTTASTESLPEEGSGRPRSDSISSQSEETRSEKMFIRMVRSIRNKFVARKLEGMIYIRRIAGVVATAMTCRVQSNTKWQDGGVDEEDVSDMPNQFQRALTTTDIILDSLERRSKSWIGVDFNEEVSITRGVSIGVSDPFLGLIGWSLAIELTATVKTLLASRTRFEVARASLSAKESSGSDRGSFSGRLSSYMPSFSFSSSSKKVAEEAVSGLGVVGEVDGRDSDVSEERDSDEPVK